MALRSRKSGNRCAPAEGSARLRLETLESRELLTTFYVDGAGGNDAADGETLGTPFETIQAAANAAQSGDLVLIRGGVYREEVDVPRSGSSSAPIVFSAYQDEEVVISGADLVSGWTLDATVGPNVWRATVNWDAEGNRDGNTLFVDGAWQHEARQGGDNDPLDINDWGQVPNGQIDDGISSFVVNDLGAFPNDHWNGGKIKFHTFDYAFATKTIADFNSGTGRITLDSAIGVATQKQQNGYYIYDTINALDSPGEWFKGAGSSTLYYQADVGENPNAQEMEFKRRAYGFDVSNRDHLRIEGITFRGTGVDAGGNADNNTFAGNRFYAFDKAGLGRFSLTGDNNVVRDNEFSHTWSSALVIGGVRNAVVNNYLHNIGFDGTTRVVSATSASELLVSHNTIQKYARGFMDGYPVRSEIAYNVFEDGGRLSWDTGVFDSDGSNGNSSYSTFHHNIFRDNANSRGIFEAFYGLNNNAVIHHNLFYDFTDDRPVLRASGTEFRQAYHNTVITTVDTAPAGELEARDAIGTRYNNNVQITLERMEALGVDVRGNHNYSPSDFIDFANNDYQLAAGSGAIDTGIILPGINDDFLGAAPDAGAFEFGAPAWEAGHDFATPPNPTYSWVPLPGTNLFDNGQFLEGIGDWTVVSGSPNSLDRNSWNLQSSGAALTGTFRTQSVELTPGEAIRKTFEGLKPNTTYTLGATARLANRIGNASDYDTSSGSISTGTHRGEPYVTGLSGSEWVEYRDVDFGEPGQYDQLDLLHIRNPSGFSASLDGVGVEVRLGSSNGLLLADFDSLADGNTSDRWRANRADFGEVSGLQSIYVSVLGANASNLALGSFRLLKQGTPPDDLLTAKVSSIGAPAQAVRIGSEDWSLGYEEVVFTTGPFATEATVDFTNGGRLDAYLDRMYLTEGYSNRGAEPRDLSTGTQAYKSISPTQSELALSLTDGSDTTETTAGDHAGNWVQVDLNRTEAISSIELTPPLTQPARLGNFRVSVWSADPNRGGTLVWSQDYLTDGQAMGVGEVLQIQSSAIGRDGVTELNAVPGRFVRIESLGENSQGDQRIAIGELRVKGFDRNNLSITDSTVRQSTSSGGGSAELAVDNDPTTFSETDASAANSWWQTRFSQPFSIGRIELQNRDDSLFSDLSNFRVSVWDEDPASGGTKLWEKSYFSTGSVGQGETFVIDGSESSDTSTLRLATVHTGRVVLVELVGPGGKNNNNNGRLSFAGVRVASSDTVVPIGNTAQRGVATQLREFYGDTNPATAIGYATDANDGLISPITNFTSTRPETGTWWQVEVDGAEPIEQVVVFNRTDAASRLNNFRVSVWDDDPDNGGTELWGRTNFYSGSAATYSTGNTIGPGGALIIDGGDTDGGTRLDSVTGGRYVRVQLLGSNILSVAEVQVWTGSQAIDFAPADTSWDFDFGTNSSPVQAGWTSVTPTTYGDARWSRVIGAESRSSGGGSTVNRDFATDTDAATLDLKVPNGVYDVTLNLGDATAIRDNMAVWAEGQLIAAGIDSPVGQYSYVDENGASATPKTFQVVVRDGEFNLQLDDSGDEPGAEPGWVLNRLSLTRVDDLPPGPDNALQLLVDADGGGLLRNETGSPLSLIGYTIGSDGDALLPAEWVGLGNQQYNGTGWTESSSSAGSLAESGAAIVIPNGGQIYLGQVLDPAVSPDADFQFQLNGGGVVEGYFATTADLQIPLLVGDFNGDLSVDAADYTSWRDSLGDSVAAFSEADANGDSRVDQSDKRFWQARYGDSFAVVDLIDATTGNGSFEDWGAQDALTRLLTNNSTASLPGWTVDTTGNGGWIRQGDAAATVGASSDGIAYAIATGGATVVLTSDPLSHLTAEGEEFLVKLDVGSKDGSDNNYEVSLVFGGQERLVGSFLDGPNATAEGLNTHELGYAATAADAGLAPVLKITMTVNGSFSQAFVDNVSVRAVSTGASSSLIVAAAPSASAASTPAIQTPVAESIGVQPVGAREIDQAFLVDAAEQSPSQSDGTTAADPPLSVIEFPLSETLLIDADPWGSRFETDVDESLLIEASRESATQDASDEAFSTLGQDLG